MMTSPRSHLPTEGEALLLRAAFGGADEARRAWLRWRGTRDLDRIEQSEFRLLPLVARCGLAIPADDPLLGRMLGIHRRAWLDGQLRLRAAAPLIRSFAERGIRTVLMKGAALGLDAYPDPGSRPMADVDLLVPEERLVEAMDAARRHGFDPLVPGSPRRSLRRTHAIALGRTADPQALIDLHGRPLSLLVPRSFERELLDRARPIDAAGAPAFVPDPADHLLIVADHGVRPNTVGPTRWAADAAMLIRRHGESIDWTRLLHDARRCRLVWTLGQVLRFVRAELGAAVPDGVLARLDEAPISWTERLERPRRLRTHAAAGDAASLLAPWLRLGVRGADAWRFVPSVALLTPVRAAWFAWKHAVLRPQRSLRASAARSHPHAQ